MLKKERIKLSGAGKSEVVTVLTALAEPDSELMKAYALKLGDGSMHRKTFDKIPKVAASMLDKYTSDVESKGPAKAYERLVTTCSSRQYIWEDPNFTILEHARATYIVMSHIAWYAKDYDRSTSLAPGNGVLSFEFAPEDNIIETYQAHTPRLIKIVAIGQFNTQFGDGKTFDKVNVAGDRSTVIFF